MKYTKPPLTHEQQADQLLQRGMSGDRSLMVSRLASVNYYRLTAYWLPFRDGLSAIRDKIMPDYIRVRTLTPFDLDPTGYGRYLPDSTPAGRVARQLTSVGFPFGGRDAEGWQ